MLCHAWVRISTNPIVGDSQKNKHEDFTQRHGDKQIVARNAKACDQRFAHIHADCNKWSAALKRVRDYPRSGENVQDAELAAQVIYRGQTNDKPFELHHRWRILVLDTRDLSVTKHEEQVNEDSPTPTEGRKRPLGRKTMKDKDNGKSSSEKTKSDDAHNQLGNRLAKSIDDFHATSAAHWQRSS
ncbi:hypothetical protein Dimus_020863 [Dionaea muscipula]